MNKEQRSFKHLKDQASIKPMTMRTKTKVFIFVSLIVLLIFIMMCFHSSKKNPQQLNIEKTSNTNSATLVANANRIKALEQANLKRDLNSLTQKNNNKAFIARMNAPTQVYSAKLSTTTTSSRSPQSNKLLIGNSPYSQFANSQDSQATSVSAERINHPEFTVAQGEFIHAALETAINSDLPGMIRATVTRPVYSYLGEHCLIPAGSRIIGQYTSLAGNGAATERVFVIWNRIITPKGLSLTLNSPGVDTLGRAGLKADHINTHFLRIFSSATLLSIMAATTANYQVGSFDQPNSANQYQQSIAASFQQAAKNSLQGNLQIKPTLSINQGASITIFVAHNLSFYSALQHE